MTQVDSGQVKTKDFDPFFDSVSKLYSPEFGNGSLFDLCGYNQVYSVFEVDGNGQKQPTSLVYLTPGETELNVRPTTAADEGFHNMVLTVELPDFNISHDQSFLVLVGDCDITGMQIQQPADTVIDYQIYQPGVQQFVPYPDITIVPAKCQKGFIFSIVEVGTNVTPSWVTAGATGFTILTDDANLPGVKPSYNLELRIAPDGPNTVGSQYIVYTVNFERCHLDQVSITQLIQDFDYHIASGPVTKQGSFSNLYPECEYSLLLKEQVFTGFDLSMFTLNWLSKSFTLDTSDYLLDKQSVNLMF